jgi:type I restriction enzyme M protein
MLDNLTKRRIDTARNILVGKLPDPKSQVDQITIALIYKFMDDMDKQAEELGGEASFFTGEYEKYSWSKIFDPHVSGYDLVGLYGEAIQKMNYNPNIPQLFRNIFKNVNLPYRDPETLKMFLKVIGEFKYDHSEKLGDAFEYLLSIMDSQGDAGSFRTPRHIIDFMVKVVDPSKNETILDPACGTAGFLISSFNHIRNKNKKDGRINLTPDERARLIENLSGYDISPDMVRLSLVNMYLHGFQGPKIYEYDTLTSEEKWNEFYDIILANPPFMSPNGGIKPHKRFSIQAKRSEVLFVDYIAEHLNPNGRGGVIVPEGIIFKSETAYKKLRKMLVENSLYAVVSLPAGVFNPYSGVKTSILFLNKNFAKKTANILFVKVNNDGFGLGAQRREIKENDLPLALEIINKYKQCIIEEKEIEFNLNETKLANIVKKEKIAESGDYNLSGDRYKSATVYNGKWDFAELLEIAEVIAGQSPKGEYYNKNRDGVPFYQGKKEFTEMYISEPKIWTSRITKIAKKGDILMSVRAPVGPINISTQKICIGRGLSAIRPNEKIKLLYLFYCLKSIEEKIQGNGGSVFDSINTEQIKKIKIPLPPLEIQEQIVAELDSYQKIIDGARQVVENYKPTFKIDPEWEIMEIGEMCNLMTGGTPKSTVKEYYGGNIKWIVSGDVHLGEIFDCPNRITQKGLENSNAKYLPIDSVLIALNGQGKTRGTVALLKTKATCNQSIVSILPKDKNKLISEYLYAILKIMYVQIRNLTGDIQRSGLNMSLIKKIKIPFPPLEIQKQIIARIENEQKAIDSNKELITIFENKIKDKIAEVWGE